MNVDHLGQVPESYYMMKHQTNHHQIFIWVETCFSPEIRCDTIEITCHCVIPYCFVSEDAVSKTRASFFITGFEHLGGLLLSSVTVFVTRDEALPIVFDIMSNVITINLPLYSVYDWLQWDCLSAGYLCFAMLRLCCLFRFSMLHNFHKP